MRFTFVYENNEYPIDLERLGDDRYQALIDGRTVVFNAAQLTDGRWLVRMDEQQHVLAVATGDAHYVQVAGDAYRLESANRRQRTRSGVQTSDGVRLLLAQMPGQVRAVFVQVGDHVQRGQALLTLEAMKMELRISAPSDGVVNELWVQVGEIVKKDQQLVRFTAAT
jgi:pyruvate carboxylase subunit B